MSKFKVLKVLPPMFNQYTEGAVIEGTNAEFGGLVEQGYLEFMENDEIVPSEPEAVTTDEEIKKNEEPLSVSSNDVAPTSDTAETVSNSDQPVTGAPEGAESDPPSSIEPDPVANL